MSALLNSGQNESTNDTSVTNMPDNSQDFCLFQTLIHNGEIKLTVTSDIVKIISLTAVPPAGAERMEEITMYVLYGNVTLAWLPFTTFQLPNNFDTSV